MRQKKKKGLFIEIYQVSVISVKQQVTPPYSPKPLDSCRVVVCVTGNGLALKRLPEVGFEPTRTSVHWNLSPTP